VAYNLIVPTPFYHLSVAEDLLQRPDLPTGVRDFLNHYRPEFLFGNTAPDVQTISGQPRPATHFFDVPILPGASAAWDAILAAHPQLAETLRLNESQAAFLAGYLCHLQADWMWVLDIFLPIFGPWNSWRTLKQRLYLHNVLRAYLDRQILDGLQSQVDGDLDAAHPMHWLPFVEDLYLLKWRNLLARQLHPGAAAQTVEVFAARQGIDPYAFYRLLESEDRLDREIFSKLPRQELDRYRQRLIDENVRLLNQYLRPLSTYPAQ
jgi:hypothetical protein